jgi:hypothetical protein
MDIKHIFDKLGGTAHVASFLGEKQTTISAMKRRNKLPIHHWDSIIDQCKTSRVRGVNYKFLVNLHKDGLQ